jgi:SAM-dependent methyltransferase
VDKIEQIAYVDQADKPKDLYATTKYAILERYLRGHGPLRVFNAGCGSGELSLRLARQGHTVVGIDPEPSYIALAVEKARAAGTDHCTFEVSSIETYAGPGGFDCVVSTDVLEHIEDDRVAFAKLASLVRPGGLVLLALPAVPWLFGYHDELLGHYRRYSKRTLRALVGEHCEVESLRYFGFCLVPVSLLFSRWLRRPLPFQEAVDPGRRPVSAWLLRMLFGIEQRLPLPLGVSVLLKAVRKQDVALARHAA